MQGNTQYNLAGSLNVIKIFYIEIESTTLMISQIL